MSNTDWVIAIATGAAAIAAGGSVVAAFKSVRATREAADAARESAATARELVSIEKTRRHDELNPEFRVSLRDVNTTSKTAKLAIELAGPSALDQLDSIVVSFRTDGMMRGDVDNVFGPVRFEHDIDGAPSRTESAAKPIKRGAFVLLQVEETATHAEGWDDSTWARMFHNQPVRLRIDCAKDGYEPWFVTVDIDGPNFTPVAESIWKTGPRLR